MGPDAVGVAHDRSGGDRFTRGGLDTANAAPLDDDLANRGVGADVDAEIDGYIGQRYTLPLAAPAPKLLVRLACDIARYRLAFDSGLMNEQIEVRYKAAVALLRDLAKGVATLGIDAPVVTDGPLVAAGERIFTRKTLEMF